MIPAICHAEPHAPVEKKVLTLSRYMSGLYSSLPQLLEEEGVPEHWLYQWRLEYNARHYQYFSQEKNRDYKKPLDRQNIVAVIPARGGSKGLPGKALRLLNGKPVLAYTIEACLQSRYINRVVITTDDPDIARIAREWGAEVPFLRPAILSTDHVDLSHVIIHAVTYLEMAQDYWYDFLFQLSATYPLRTAEDLDRAFESFVGTEFRSLQSVDPISTPPRPFCRLQGSRIQPLRIAKKGKGRLYAQSGFVKIMSRRPNYHIPISEYEQFFSKTMNNLAFVTPPEKAVDIDTPRDFLLCQEILKPGDAGEIEPEGIERLLRSLPRPGRPEKKAPMANSLGILRLDGTEREYVHRDAPLICGPLRVLLESGCFSALAVVGEAVPVRALAEWAGLPFVKGRDCFRSDGLPRSEVVGRLEREFRTAFQDIFVVDGRAPLLDKDVIEGFSSAHARGPGMTTASVSIPAHHPYWCKTIKDGAVQPAYVNGFVGQRQKLPPLYEIDGVLRASARQVLGKAGRAAFETGYLLQGPTPLRIQSRLDYQRFRAWTQNHLSGKG